MLHLIVPHFLKLEDKCMSGIPHGLMVEPRSILCLAKSNQIFRMDVMEKQQMSGTAKNGWKLEHC